MAQPYSDFSYQAQNEAMKKALIHSVKSLFPIVNKNKELEVSNIRVVDKLNDQDFPAQREIKLNRKTWNMPVVADFKIVDKSTGRVLDKMESKKIGNLPKITNRYTTIIDGNEYQTANQFRRKSGVYSRIKKNGELEAEFNLSKGKNFKMMMDPITGVFYMIFANRKYRVWTILNLLGVKDSDFIKAWGKDIFEKNKKGAENTSSSELKAIYNIVYNQQPKSLIEAEAGLIRYFTDGTEMDADVNKLTLGQAYEKVDSKSLLATSEKLLNINKGNDVPDERDSLVFKDLYSIDDLVNSYFNKNSKVLKTKLARNLGLRERIKDIVTPSTFSDPVKKFFTVGDLASTPPQTNPVTILAETRKTTPMGIGGITNSHAVTIDMRNLHPSHLGFLDALATPESSKIGINLGLASEIRKKDKNLYAPIRDLDNKIHWFSPLQMHENIIGFPDQFKLSPNQDKVIPIGKTVKAMKQGKTVEIPASEVKYYLRSPKTMFSIQSNLVPFLASTQGNRAGTGARMLTQALPLANPDSPLLETLRDKNSTYEQLVGQSLGPNSDTDGTVSKIDDDYIYVKDKSGIEHKYGMYKDFPLNQDGFVDSHPIVKVGQSVKKGELLAGNNYTKGNKLAIAKNLNTGFLSYKGLNFEDGVVVTEGAAKKLTHETIHKENIYFSPSLTVFDKKKFNAWYPDEISPANYNKLNSTGIIGKGQRVIYGDVIAAYLVEKQMNDLDNALKKLDKITFNKYEKKILRWDNEDPGTVVDVRKVGRNIDIYIKAEHPLKEGDKLSSLYGNKGIVTAVIPDDDAPHRPNGEPIEIMMSAEGVPGRMNIGQIHATAASKIAEKEGKPYIVNNFNDPNGDITKTLIDKAKKIGLNYDEVLTEGKNGKKILKPIFVGKQPIIKLRHIIAKKQGAHSIGAYDVYEQPAGKGAQHIGALDVYGYLAHGAKNNLEEISTIKGRKNEEYWRDLQFGLPPSKPSRNFVWDKMMTDLKGMGVNVEKNGNKIRIMPLTDKDITSMSSGEIKDPGTLLIGKNLLAKKGGLFDKEITGGAQGTNWSHFNLASRIPNPMFEDATMKILNLTENKYANVISGKDTLDGKTGTDAIVSALGGVNVNNELKSKKEELKNAPPTNVNKLNTTVKYLQALKNLKMTPTEAYTLSKLPITPPKFRPIYPLPSGDLMISDINKHYKDIGVINNGLKANLKDGNLTKEKEVESKAVLYNTVKALQGIIDPMTYSKQKYKGFLKEFGKVKTGLVHGRAWSKAQDLSGRSTITVEPDLDIDEVGVPKGMAYKMWKPLVIKELKSYGLKASEAKKQYDDKTTLANKALAQVADEHPVILNRAPSLHKHSIQGFKPILVDGKAIRLNPLILKGFNADHDGDEQINSVIFFAKDAEFEQFIEKRKRSNLELDIKLKTSYTPNIINKKYMEDLMAARFNVELPNVKEGKFYIANLEDFPYDHDTLLGTKEHIDFYSVPKGIKVFAYDEKRKKIILTNVGGWSIHKDREVWVVTLQNNQQIITDDDPRAVYGLHKNSLTMSRSNPEHSKDMLVPVVKNLSKAQNVGWPTMSIKGALTDKSKLHKNIPLNKEVGYVLGCLVGDGWYDEIRGKFSRVILSGIEPNVVDKYKNSLQDIFIKTPHVGHIIINTSYGKSEKHTISSKDFAEWVAALIGKGAKNKHLPPMWFNSSKDFKLGLLSGLLDTDGSIVVNKSKNKKQLVYNYSSISIRLMQELQQLLLTLGVRSRITFGKKTEAGNDFWGLNISSVDMLKIKNELCNVHAMNIKNMNDPSVQPNPNASSSIKTDLIPITDEIINLFKDKIGAKRNNPKELKTLYSILQTSLTKTGYITRATAKKLLDKYPDTIDNKQWLSIVNNEDITWQPVKKVENTGKKETGYDLTVPGYETFMSVDGIILSNTMSIMTPIGKKAIEEAKDIMPSKILFKHGDNSLVPGLEKDYIFGLYEASKIGVDSGKSFKTITEAKKSKLGTTDVFNLNGKKMTIGQYYINKPLPDSLKDYTREMSKKTTQALLSKLGKEYASYFSTVISTWKDIGFKYAYDYGHTISINDFNIDKSYRNDLIKKELPKIKKLKTKEAKIKAYNALTLKVQKAQNKYIQKSKNNLKDMVNSGSFSKKDSVRQILSMPGILTDIKGDPIEVPVLKSYGEGLDTAAYFNALYAVRKGTVDRAVNTQETGALTKSLLNVARRTTIVEEDCNTVKHIMVPVDSKDVFDRFAALTIPGVVNRNQLISSETIEKAKRKNITELPVRSPLTCEAVNGICQKCYGLLPSGVVPSIGTNVGILDGHALTERSTQLTLQTFHCYHGGSLVQTENGELRLIRDLVEEDYRGKVLDRGGEFTEVLETSKHKVTDKMRVIMSRNKRQIIAQGNHPIQVKTNDYKCYYCDSVRIFKYDKDRWHCTNCFSKFSKDKLIHTSKYVTKEIKDVNRWDESLIRSPFEANFGAQRWDWDISPTDVAHYITARNKKVELEFDKETKDRLAKECGADRIERRLPAKILLYDKKVAYELVMTIFKDLGKFFYNGKWSYRKHYIGNVYLFTHNYYLANQLPIILQKFGLTASLTTYSKKRSMNKYLVKITNIKERRWRGLVNLKYIIENPIKQFLDFPERSNYVSRIKHFFHNVSEDPYVYDLKTKSETLSVNEIWAHNSGGSALAGGGALEGFPNVKRLLQVPDKLANKATLALNNGIVQSVQKNSVGGFDITIDGVKHISLPGQAPIVKSGDVVEKGDALTEGMIKPQELGKLKTHLDAEKYVVGEMNNVFKNKFNKKTFETIVRSVADNAEITFAPPDTDFIRGDKTTISFVESLNKERKKEGLELIQYRPYFKSIETLNVDNPDWLTKVTTNRIKAAIRTGAAKGQFTNLSGKDPIPAYIYGDNFAKNVSK